MTDAKKVIVIPCSGIGKAYGSVGREAMYQVVEQLRPDSADTVCLSLLRWAMPRRKPKSVSIRPSPSTAAESVRARVNVQRGCAAGRGISGL